MSTKPLLLGIGGSLRPESGSLVALQYALDRSERAGAETTLLSLADLDLPLYDDRADASTYPPAVARLLDAVRRADGLIISSPVYHGTMSGSVKNALDFLELLADDNPPWLEDKVAALITVSGGRPRSDAIVSLEIACRALHASVVPFAVSISDRSFADGELRDEAIQRRIDRLADHTVKAALASRHN